MLTRRQLLISAGATIEPEATVPRAGVRDRRLLHHAFEVERLLVWGYEHVLSTGRLEPAGRAVVAAQLEHERAHVTALEQALGTGRVPRLTPAAARAGLARHHVSANPDRLSTQRHSVRLLVDLESVAEGAWFQALSKLESPPLALLGAQILACEAQHWTALSELSHPDLAAITVPNAFVRGT